MFNSSEEYYNRLGAETMLEAIFQWSDSSQIEQWVEWFDDEYGN